MKRPGLYVHIPFCKTKCPYCDFYSITDLSLADPWLEALDKEAALYEGVFGTFDSVYLGGGTPSVLDNRQAEALVNIIRAHFALAGDTEFTIEANPDDVTADRLQTWRSLGVNRVSMGVQSFDDAELVFLKRRHDAAAAQRAVGLVGSSGIENYGIDLMYGLPGQAEDAWVKTLDRALAFRPAHLSCYQLTIGEHTPFGRLKAEGRLRTPGERKERRLFLLTSDHLGSNGFIHYEVSNFAGSRQYESRHNRKYWEHAPYLGLGPAAHSFRDGTRWWNHGSVERYCKALAGGERPIDGLETLSPEQLRLERLFLGFRTDRGVDLADASGTPSFDETLLRLRRSRLVTVRNNRIIPTRKGYLMADRLPLMFRD